MLKQLLRGVTLSKKFGPFALRRFGVITNDFGPLLRKFGVEAGHEISKLEAAFENYLETGAEASSTTFWRTYERLSESVATLNQNEQIRVGLELERRAQTLLSKEDDFGRYWALENQKVIRARLRAAAKEAEKEVSVSKVQSKWHDLMRGARGEQSALYAVWTRFRQVVSPKDSSVQAALRIAVEDAQKVKALLKSKMSAAARLEKLRGFMVTVRGPLGEGYALLSEKWLKLVDEHLADAKRIAEELGEGWKAHYLTQLDNGIRLNRREGADAIIVIVNRKTREAILHTSAQVKTAKASEAIEQTMDDQLRNVGQQAKEIYPLGTLEVRLEMDAKPMALNLVMRPQVRRPNLYILNAAGSRLPKKDLEVLTELGLTVSEIQLDISVDQLTHLAVSMMEAALKTKL